MPMTSPEPPAQPPPPPASPPTVSAGSRTVTPPPPHAPAAADLTAGGRAASDAAQTGAAVTGTAAHRGAWLEPTYELIMVAIWGARVGKMLMRIHVVSAAEGTRPGFGRSLLRWLIPGLCAYVPFVGGFGTLLCYLTLFIDTKRRQGLHDKAASTVVISTADR